MIFGRLGPGLLWVQGTSTSRELCGEGLRTKVGRVRWSVWAEMIFSEISQQTENRDTAELSDWT